MLSINFVRRAREVLFKPALRKHFSVRHHFMTEHLNISLNNNASICNDIWAVCADVTEHYKSLVPQGTPLGAKPLYVVHNPSTPIAFVNGLPNYYSIGLTVNERLYNQIAYQFAHELTHIYCDPRITNWFIESLCEMASLYFLDYLADKWMTLPPFPNWTDYAPRFLEYKADRENEVKTSFGITDIDSLNNQFRTILTSISEPYNRNANTVIAIKLIDCFRDNKNFWKLLPIVGQATDKTLTEGCFFENSIPDFDKLIELSSGEIRELAEEIKRRIKNDA